MSERKEGVVKWYNSRKGYGFVQGDDNEDYFVHFSAIPKGTFLRENDRVAFDAANTDKGMQAQNAELLQKGSEIKQEGSEEAPVEEEQSVEESQEEAPVEEEQSVEEGSEEFGEEEKKE
jgi:cold shock protein